MFLFLLPQAAMGYGIARFKLRFHSVANIEHFTPKKKKWKTLSLENANFSFKLRARSSKTIEAKEGQTELKLTKDTGFKENQQQEILIAVLDKPNV